MSTERTKPVEALFSRIKALYPRASLLHIGETGGSGFAKLRLDTGAHPIVIEIDWDRGRQYEICIYDDANNHVEYQGYGSEIKFAAAEAAFIATVKKQIRRY